MNLELCEVADVSPLGLATLSPFCLKVQRALHVAGLPYTRRHGALPSSHKALNPTGQVPVLLVDGRPIADSTAILQWIVEQGGLEASPEAWLFEELADTGLNGFIVASRWADETNWPRMKAEVFGGLPPGLRWFVSAWARAGVVKRLVARDFWRAGPDACWVRFRTLLDHLDARAPADGFWCGPKVSVADVALFGQLQSLRCEITPAQRAEVERRPRLLAWLGRVDAATAAP